MVLYVRSKNKWVNYLHDVNEFRTFVDNYIPGTKLVIGDVALFSTPMKNMLLKFLEDNPIVDCYSSEEIADSVLLSRFVEIKKESMALTPITIEEFKDSDKGFSSAMALGLSSTVSLNLYHAPDYVINILSEL